MPFPMPGDDLHDHDANLYRVVASDHYTESQAVCLATVRDAPHFVIVMVALETGSVVTVSARAANIGTAVAYYAEWGGTVNDVDPYPSQGISIDKLRATRDEMPA